MGCLQMYVEALFLLQTKIYYMEIILKVTPEQLSPYAVVVPTMTAEGQDEEKKPLDGPMVAAYPTYGKSMCSLRCWK